MKQPEALRLAEQLRDLSTMFKTPSHEKGVCNGASFEIRRLHEANQAMLEALKELKSAVNSAITCGDWVVDGACDPDACLRRVEAAIAKATGE